MGKTGRNNTLKYSDYLLWVVLYLSVPVLIFLFGTLKLYIGIPLGILWGFFSFLAVKEGRKNTSAIEVKPVYLIFVFLLFILLSVLVGIGEFVWADDDHKIRYAMLNDLISYSWPVKYDLANQGNPLVRDILGEGNVSLVYYYIYWMVPALFGKAFGLTAARIVLVIWSAIGLTLSYIGIAFITKKLQKRALFIMVLFGGLDIVAFLVKSNFGFENITLEMWNEPYTIHGNFAQLMNVFNQSIPCWLIGEIIYMSRSKSSLGFFGSLMFCYSPWATIGLVPLAFCKLLYDTDKRKFSISESKKALTINNIAPAAVVLVVLGSFYTATANSMNIRGFVWDVKSDVPNLMLGYVLYIIVEFGFWLLILFKRYNRNPYFYVIICELLLLPLYVISEVNDFLMRGSLVPVLFISLMLIEFISDINFKKIAETDRLKLYALVLTVIVAFSGILQTLNIVVATASGEEDNSRSIVSFGDIRDEDQAEIVSRNYFSSECQDKFFFKYLAK